mmetsp:Transcript_26811/g.37688  ORF Transcript_26811/g.37688 Transcript_26811/m.37688 type:complete len:166 (-) Transcript_26811:1322-1819(-)
MSATPQAPPGTTNLDNMPLDQLQQVKQQEEQRLQALTSRYAQLRAAAARIHASQRAVQDLQPATEGQEVMVPLTASLYVPGTLKEPTKLLVELGTGYYCEKSPTQTVDYLGRKLKIVDSNSENVTKVIQVTRQNVDSVGMAMQGKLLEIRARQEGQRYKNSQLES